MNHVLQRTPGKEDVEQRSRGRGGGNGWGRDAQEVSTELRT